MMLISYYIFYATHCNLFSVVSVSVISNITGNSIKIFDKTFNFSFYNGSRLSYEVRKYQKINLLTSKDSSNSDNMALNWCCV